MEGGEREKKKEEEEKEISVKREGSQERERR